jgi:hypothetical protein
MTIRRPTIPQRKPIFVGCEGESEQGYARFLQDLAREANLHVYLKIEILKAGDPLARIELAVSKLDRLRRTNGSFAYKFVFLDTDQLLQSPDRAARARQLAQNHNIKIIWQQPCFEAVLLRHFVGRNTVMPPDSTTAQSALLREWPEYCKPLSRLELTRKLNREAVMRAAQVENELMTLLRCIGLI